MENNYWLPHKLLSIDPIVVGTVTTSKYGRDVVLCNALSYIEEGEGILELYGRKYPLSAGDVFVIPYNSVSSHYVLENTNWKIYWIGFLATFDVDSFIKTPVFKLPEARDIFLSVVKHDLHSANAHMFVSAKVFELLRIITEYGGFAEQTNEMCVEYTKQFIQNNYQHNIHISSIAEQLFISRNHLSSSFKSRIGISPKQYLSIYRLYKAAELLQKKEYLINQVMTAVGYDDMSNFTKAFSAYIGYSPRHFHKMTAEEKQKILITLNQKYDLE